MQTHDFWLIDDDIESALECASRLPYAEALGYVYVLSLSNDMRKIGSTAQLAQRLARHRVETARYGVAIKRCFVTRPHFNFRSVEARALRCFGSDGRREILPAALSEIRRAIEAQTLHWTAPDDYVQQHRSSRALCNSIMQKIAAGLGIGTEGLLTREASSILDSHVELGHHTGLCKSASMFNALAVIEAQLGLDLRALRNVLQEVA